MDEVLNRLATYVAEHPKTAIFAPPASAEAIAAAERALKLTIPDQYNAFLRRFDGGFITDLLTRNDRESYEHAAWNSNQIMGLTGLASATEALQDMYWNTDDPWEYLGFCHLSDQQFLAFAPPSHASPGAVLLVLEGCNPSEWSVIYPTFEAYLDAYLRLEGSDEVGYPGRLKS